MSHRRSSHNTIHASQYNTFDDHYQHLLETAESLRQAVCREKENLIASRRDSQQKLSELEHKQKGFIADAEIKGRQAVLDEYSARKHAIISFEWLINARDRSILREHEVKHLKDIDRTHAATEALNIFTKLHSDDVFHVTINVTFKDESGRGEGVLREFLTIAWRDILSDEVGPYFWGETWKLPSNNLQLLLPQTLHHQDTYASRCCYLAPPISVIRALGRLWVFSMAHGVYPPLHPVLFKGLCDPASESVSGKFALDLAKFSKRINNLIGSLEKRGNVEAFAELYKQFPGLNVLDSTLLENNIIKKEHFPIITAFISDHVLYSHNKHIIQQFLQPFVSNSQWARESISAENDILAMRDTYVGKIALDTRAVAKAFVLDHDNSISDEKEFILELLRQTITCHFKNHHELEKLLLFITASVTIQPIALMVNTTDQRRIPVVRTCVPRIELSDRYDTTDELYQDLQFAMSCEHDTFSFI